MSRPVLCLILSVSFLFAIGLLMVFNTSSAQVIDQVSDASTHAALIKQALYGAMGLGLGFCFYQWGYDSVLRWSPMALFVLCVLLAILLVPGLIPAVNGAKRWIFLWGYSFQPSECVKIVLPAVYIRWYLQQKKPIAFKPFLRQLAILSIPLVLILVEPDNGTTAILFCLLVLLFFLTRIRLLYWAFPLCGLIALGGVAALQMPHTKRRLEIYIHPELDLKGKGHQPHQARIAAGSGQLWGRGLGESLQKLNYLPEARSDYIAAIYAEEFGFIGILGLIGLYMGFCYSGFLIALRTSHQAAFLFATVLTFLISLQAFLNLGIVSGLLPSKGMTLPFFSQGGTSLVINLVIVFLLLDVSRRGQKRVDDVL